MKRIIILLSVIISVFSCAIAPAKTKIKAPELRTLSKDELTSEIRGVISRPQMKDANIGVLIVDAKTNEVLFSQNEDKFYRPASTNKLLTTSAALFTLGRDFKYETKLCANGAIKDGVLNGDLVIVGMGDPSFSPRFTKDKDDITGIFKQWADELAKKGVKRIKGDIIGDDDFFDDDYFLDSWYAGERGEWFSAEVSGLAFNDNCVDLFVKGGEKEGDPAEISVKPPTDYVKIINGIKTVEKNPRDMYFDRDDKSNDIKATGEIAAGKTQRAWATVYNPTLFCVTVFKDTLKEKGISVDGIANDIDSYPDKSRYKSSLTTIAVYESPQLIEMVNVINRISHNFYAEHIYKGLGKMVKGDGSFANGALAVQDFLKKNNIYKEGHVMVDGSGLSYKNQVSPRMFVDLLSYIYKSDMFDAFQYSLPEGGIRGSLSARFKGSDKEKFLGQQIYAKTGFIRKVTTLCGYVKPEKGRDVIFSFLLNDYNCSNKEARDTIDAAMCLVSEYCLTSPPDAK